MTASTTLPISTDLFILTDWISLSKPSLTKPPFPLPPSSPSSLPSLSIPSISCHNNNIYPFPPPYIIEPTFLKFNLPLSSHLFTCIQDINQEVIVANTPNTKSTFTGPLFQILYITPMPYPGAPGSPFFKEANVSKFLERFENMCNDYRMSTSEKIRRLPWYYEMFTI